MTSVVLADDQELVRSGFRLILELAGIEVAGEAADGREALELARDQRPDVVLMDVRMPVMDGIEATRPVKVEHPGTVVLLISAYEQAELVAAGTDAGADGFLLKGSGGEALVARVRELAA